MDDDCHFWLQTKMIIATLATKKIHLRMDDDCHFGFKQKFVFKKKFLHLLASFLPSFVCAHCIALHPPSLALILAPALRYNLATIPFPFHFSLPLALTLSLLTNRPFLLVFPISSASLY
jgi:hypothetical protein